MTRLAGWFPEVLIAALALAGGCLDASDGTEAEAAGLADGCTDPGCECTDWEDDPLETVVCQPGQPAEQQWPRHQYRSCSVCTQEANGEYCRVFGEESWLFETCDELE